MKKIVITIFTVVFYLSCDDNQKPSELVSDVKLENIIEKVEPPNWWIGMKTVDLQILVYGENINDLVPKINNPSIKLNSFDKFENKNYLFFNVSITENAKPGNVEIDFYDNA